MYLEDENCVLYTSVYGMFSELGQGQLRGHSAHLQRGGYIATKYRFPIP